MTSNIVGIDLGTTNSCVSIWKDGRIVIIPNEFGNNTTPSIVSFHNSRIFVGEEAKNKPYIAEIKRLMGKSLDGYPEKISANILNYMKGVAENYLGYSINKAVVTVPAYFSDSQRKATKNAGVIAGLDIVNIINEPTAAALAYGMQKTNLDDKNILVYDLGGGTFDVTILHISSKDGENIYDVLSTTGDTNLGGEDFTTNLYNYFDNKLTKIECETAKKQLSQKDEVVIGGILVTKNIFNQINKHLFERSMIEVKKALECARLEKEEISEIILIGGSTRIVYIQEMLFNYFQKPLCKSINPDEAVAYGAGVQGAMICGLLSGNLLLDIIPLSLGIETSGGVMCVILPRCSKKPNKKSRIFTTYTENQTEIMVKIFEGESCLTKDCILLDEFIFSNIPLASKGEPKINISFSIDENGILSVSAEDLNNINNNKNIIIKNKNIISEDIMKKMIEDARANAKNNEEEKERIQLRLKLEALLYSLKKKKIKNTIIDSTQEWFKNNSGANLTEIKGKMQIILDLLN